MLSNNAKGAILKSSVAILLSISILAVGAATFSRAAWSADLDVAPASVASVSSNAISVPATHMQTRALTMSSLAQVSIQRVSNRAWSAPRVKQIINASQSPNTRYFLKNNPDFAHCGELTGAFERSGLGKFKGLTSLAEIDQFVKARINYRREGGSLDRWNNLAAAVLGNKMVEGDCDDLAITTAAVAICAGADPSRIGFAIFNAKTFKASGADHIVATYTEPSGRVIAFGDSNDPFLWNAADRQLQPKFTARASDISRWMKH